MIKIYKFQVNTKETSACMSYAYIDKTKRDKLYNKAEQCVFFVSFDKHTRGYPVYID